MNKFDVIVIGGGPAGMMAAIFAAKDSKKVLLLEKNEGLGRKLLATGNGRCNITNANISSKNFHGSSDDFFYSVYNQFGNAETINFFESIGLILKEEDRGRIFPITNQAVSVLEVLIYQMKELGVEIKTKAEVKHITKKDSWKTTLSNGDIYSSNALILTTGGKAAFQFGSSGDGLFWAKNLGHKIDYMCASLVPLEVKEEWPKKIQGLRVEANVKILVDSKDVGQKKGDLLFTHFGVSGPAILGLSRIASKSEGSKVELIIDFFPDITEKDLDAKIAEILSSSGAKNLKNALVGVVPLNLISLLLDNARLSGEVKAAEVSKESRKKLTDQLKNTKLTVAKPRPLKEAQVTAGGIIEKDINPSTLESMVIKNLFFAGEIINVDGDSGGFNLQWAWSSGFVAGRSAAQSLS